MNDPTAIKKSLNASWKEGIPANIMLVVLDYYLVPFALFLGATPKEIGFLVAAPHLIGSLSQLIAVRVVKMFKSRLKFLIYGAFIQAAILIPVSLLTFSIFPGRIVFLTAAASAFRVLSNLIGTAWGSLISEYLKPEQRGRYLGWRSQIVGIAGVFGLSCAGILLNFSKQFSLKTGFFLLFLAIAFCRFSSAFLFKKMTDVPHEEKPESSFTFFMFLRRFRKSNFVKYALYVASITFATQLAAPYFSVYMLKNLEFSYLTYMTIHLAAVTAGLVAFPIWGAHADRVGNAKVLKTTSVLIPVIPVLWLFSHHPVYLFCVEAFAGFVWGGFNLCAANFIFDAVIPEKRIRCLGYFNFINGVAIFLGASLGGVLAEILPPFLGYPILGLFLISAVIRFAAHFFLSGQFEEVRIPVERASNRELFFSVLGIRPMFGRDTEWNVLSLFKKPKDLTD